MSERVGSLAYPRDAIVSSARRVRYRYNTAYPQFQDDFMSWCAEDFVRKSSDISELKAAVWRSMEKTARDRAPEKGNHVA